MPLKTSNNLKSSKNNNGVGTSRNSKPTSETKVLKHSAVNNPVPNKGGKKSK